jgi:hypothetical protein
MLPQHTNIQVRGGFFAKSSTNPYLSLRAEMKHAPHWKAIAVSRPLKATLEPRFAPLLVDVATCCGLGAITADHPNSAAKLRFEVRDKAEVKAEQEAGEGHAAKALAEALAAAEGGKDELVGEATVVALRDIRDRPDHKLDLTPPPKVHTQAHCTY